MALPAAIFALVIILATGEGLLLLMNTRRAAGGILLRLATGFTLGTAVVATWSLGLALLPIDATPRLLIIPVLLYPVGRIIQSRHTITTKPRAATGRISLFPITVLLIVIAHIVHVFRHALLRPVHGWDAWRIWSFKAKVLLLEKGFPPDFFSGDWAGFSGYPLGIPFVETYLAHAVGYWNDSVVKILFPIFYSALLIILYTLIQSQSGKRVGFLGLLLVAPAPLLVHHGSVAYMDLPLALFLLTAVLHLTLWEKNRDRGHLLLAAVHAGFLTQIKNEGLPLFLLLTLLFLFRMRKEKNLLSNAVAWLVPSLLFSLPWLLFKYGTEIPESPYHQFVFAGFSALGERLVDFVRLLIHRMFFGGSWGIAWYTLLLLLIPKRRSEPGTTGIVFAGGLLIFAAAYLFTDSYTFLMNGTALGRNLLVLLPLGVATGLSALSTR